MLLRLLRAPLIIARASFLRAGNEWGENRRGGHQSL
ncbi:hypothetical protein MILUP08_43432 [Micromonospora lupini str. Lupac 08]|uniref:Uncharacterized protein n=1 Tax=Micromonospora lupini str. Lupac 08 TaxID=1150864 RepID=I0L3X5_9ACTN|nr:hypothetical protein MILUP08_43432 [Micromonospora lupini str. Lupac 08]